MLLRIGMWVCLGVAGYAAALLPLLVMFGTSTAARRRLDARVLREVRARAASARRSARTQARQRAGGATA